MLVDYHVHSNTSKDSKAEIKDYCRRAIELGISEICFTNHHEWPEIAGDLEDDGGYTLSEDAFERYHAEVEKARELFPGLKVLFGVEIGYKEGHEADIRKYVEDHDFDFVLVSYHWLDGIPLPDSTYEHNFSRQELLGIYKKYFQGLKNIVRMGCFDSLAHLDVFARSLGGLEFADYKAILYDFIDEMKNHEICFELNTSGWRRHTKEQHPNSDILKALFEKGIRNVTIGSDCHKVEELGFMLESGKRLLKETGFKEFCTFEKRTRKYNLL